MTTWDAGTFDGAARARLAEVASTTPAERLAWLARMQVLAASTGALQAELERRASVQSQRWVATSPEASRPRD